MKIKLLKEGYKKDELLYPAFCNGSINESFFSEETIELDEVPDFPIYMGKGTEVQKKTEFLEAFRVIATSYVNNDRDIHFNERFWHSFLIGEKRNYIIEKYPQVLDSYRDFSNIVIKTFDWENYIYKCVLAVEYIEDATDLHLSKEQYYELIVDNLDIFNYILKYPIFRNNEFMIKILTIIHNLAISDILKAKITDRPDLGKDERYGRRVIFELNKAYPVLMSPLLEVDELQVEFLKALKEYYKDEIEIESINSPVM